MLDHLNPAPMMAIVGVVIEVSCLMLSREIEMWGRRHGLGETSDLSRIYDRRSFADTTPLIKPPEAVVSSRQIGVAEIDQTLFIRSSAQTAQHIPNGRQKMNRVWSYNIVIGYLGRMRILRNQRGWGAGGAVFCQNLEVPRRN